MWHFKLETDVKKFTQEITSLGNVMKTTMMGQNTKDFGMTDLLASTTYDLPYAAKHFRFALIPKVSIYTYIDYLIISYSFL